MRWRSPFPALLAAVAAVAVPATTATLCVQWASSFGDERFGSVLLRYLWVAAFVTGIVWRRVEHVLLGCIALTVTTATVTLAPYALDPQGDGLWAVGLIYLAPLGLSLAIPVALARWLRRSLRADARRLEEVLRLQPHAVARGVTGSGELRPRERSSRS